MMKKLLLPLLALALNASAADSVLIFNELQYHPANELTETEWVELRSLQGVDVDISGWRIDGGIDYTFPAGTIMPGGGYIVIAAVPGQIPGALGPFAGQLDNGGETLRLRNRTGRIMDELSYSDSGDWPIAPDGSGVTLARRTASAASGAGQWSASKDVGGTPGGLNFLPIGSPNVRTRAIAVGDTWRYLDDGSTPAGNWSLAGFNDAAWKSGPTLITGGGGALAQARPSDYPSGLLAYWAFDETSGTAADNAVAGQPDGTMANGAAFFADPVRGKVASFDGTDDRMEVIDSGTGQPSLVFLPQMTAVNDFTWAAWVWSPINVTAADQATSVILGNRSRGAAGENASPLEFLKISPTQLLYQRNGGAENLDYADLATSAWTHMCVVKRGLNFDYYRNGAFLQTRTITTGLSNVMPFYVGGDRRTTSPLNEHFQGRIDDVGLWTRALAAGEIFALGSGYGVAPAVMPIPPEQTTTAVTGPTPRYFRKAFTFTGSPARTNIELWPVVDDGGVIYLNGIEIWRSNVPVTSEVGNASFTPAPIILPATALLKGANVLSAEVHQFSGGNTDLLFGAELITDELAPIPPDANPTLVFSEISASSDAGFFIELQNRSGSAISTAGWTLTTSAGATLALPTQNVVSGGFAVFTAASLGLAPVDGLRLNLFAPGSTEFHDARAITNRLRGLLPDGRWGHPSGATAGGVNTVSISDAIVINEIFYNGAAPTPPTVPSGEQWVELFNKSASPVDVSLWKLSDGISYQFPAATPLIPAGGYAVIAWNTAMFTSLHPGVPAFGPFSGKLGGSGDTVTLRDVNDNIADQVTYADGGRWSQWADGGGSSLELIDPHSDNSKGEAWDASDESSRSTWQNVSISGTGALVPSGNPTTWNEFNFGLLNSGEFLIDDISVKDVTQGNVELIQNGTFSGGNTNFWRIIGTQSGVVTPDPLAPGNNVLKVTATAETEHMHNNAGTTLKNGASFHTIIATDTYNITFRAKWLRGSNALHSRLYANRLPLKTLLNRPTTGGTPGAVNSRFAANIGPTFDALNHSPAVPASSQAATVSVKVADADGIGSVQLFTSTNGAAFTNSAMTTTGGGTYTGTVSGQTAGAVVQFYVRATDTLGAITFFPAGGPASRAMIQWDDGRAQLTLASGAKPHNLRVIMPGADANNLYRHENLMSNAAIPCTVILDEKEIYYRAGVSLKSSEHGRFEITRVGYNIEFPPDDLFLGTHGGISIDRSGGVVTGQSEILLKQLTNLAGGMHAPEDDLMRLVPSVATGTGFMFDGSGMLGSAILSKTRLKGDYLSNQFENGGDGMMFKYERIYVLTQTINAATRVIDGAIVPENPKIPQSTTGPPGVAVTNLGANPEIYRWYWLVEGGRDTDDYTGIINVVTALGQTGGSAAFNTQVDQNIDVNEWLRAHVPPVLYGVTDNYMAPTGSGQHNVLFYFPPGKKAVAFAWDCDFLSQANPTTTSLTGGGDIAKFIANPVWKRLYYGHMLDILNRSFNTATMTTWATHYSRFADNMVPSVSAYLTPRAAYAMNVINGTGGQTAPIAPVAFTRTSASPVSVSTPFTTVTGDGWINVAEIRLQGSLEPLAVTWTDDNSWSIPLPVSAGTNTYTLIAYTTTGVNLGSTTVTVTGTGGVFPATTGNLVVSELNFNPPGSADTTEFIELLNITGATLDLSNSHFDEELGQGIAYTFGAVQLAPGGRIVVARDRTAFLAMYPGASGQLAAGQFDPSSLDNGGERIVLYSAAGLPVFDFTYSDNLNPTDGGGRSLVRVVSSTNPNPNDYTWRASTVDGGNPGTSDAIAFSGGANIDADGDGIPALLEYELGTSDGASNPLPLTVTRDISGALIAVFTRRANADDADLGIEAVTDLTAVWAPATANKTDDTVVGTLRTETWQITPPVAAATFFIRLKATLR